MFSQNLLRKSPYQTLRFIYYQVQGQIPTIENELKVINANDLTNSQAKELLQSNNGQWMQKVKNTQVQETGIPFMGADGTQDVYTKSGLDYDLIDPIDRYFITKSSYRIITDNTIIDFKVGGMVEISGEPFKIVRVINMTSDVSTKKQLRFSYGLQKNVSKHSLKILALE